MEKEKFLKIIRGMDNVCKQVNEDIIKATPESTLRYEILQCSDLAREWDSVFKVTEFYNHNWTGNKDYMHIPNFKQVIENCLNYPIIIAREEGKDEILAISTIKYEENTEDKIDPYFPEEDAKYFSITGILVKKDAERRGMGKKIYEIAIRGVHEYKEEYPDTRLMCVIDCRNNHSLKALSVAAQNIAESGVLGKDIELPASILGYYELKNGDGKLEEAPTLVLEVDLHERKKEYEPGEEFNFHREEGKDLYDSIRSQLRNVIDSYGVREPVVMEDTDVGKVFYYTLEKQISLDEININSNGTEEGNDRIPVDNKDMYNFVGPMRGIYVEDER